jgi:hypothetical protein
MMHVAENRRQECCSQRNQMHGIQITSNFKQTFLVKQSYRNTLMEHIKCVSTNLHPTVVTLQTVETLRIK